MQRVCIRFEKGVGREGRELAGDGEQNSTALHDLLATARSTGKASEVWVWPANGATSSTLMLSRSARAWSAPAEFSTSRLHQPCSHRGPKDTRRAAFTSTFASGCVAIWGLWYNGLTSSHNLHGLCDFSGASKRLKYCSCPWTLDQKPK